MSAAKKPDQASPPAKGSIVSQFGRDDETFDQVPVGLPPMARRTAVARPAGKVVDLSMMARTWMLIGRGGTGKTLIARWLAGMLAERGLLDKALLAALDPTNRTLTQFFDGVQQPGTGESEDAATFLRRLVKFASANKLHGVWDFGGGDLSLAKLIDLDPKFDRAMAERGAAVIAAYTFSPSIDDLSILSSFEERGFQPEATALILNLGKAESLSAFGALRAQAAYKQALDRGAVEIVVPALEPASLALEIERRRLHFFEVRDEVVPPGATSAPIDGFDAMMLRDWLARVDAAFLPLETWLPWT